MKNKLYEKAPTKIKFQVALLPVAFAVSSRRVSQCSEMV